MSLNLPKFVTPRFVAIHPDTGRPVSGGTVAFYSNRTSILKNVYLDSAGAAVASNPHDLDAAGGCDLYLNGAYTIEVRDANGDLVYNEDNVNSVIQDSETPDPNALLATENLSDLTDVPTARASLGLVKQTGTLDSTANRVMMTGAFGLGGNAPTSLASDFDDILVPSVYNIANPALLTNAPPAAATAGLLVVRRRTSDYIEQIFTNVSGSSSSSLLRWRRAYYGTAWTPWTVDFNQRSILGTVAQSGGVPTGAVMEKVSVSSGQATRFASGLQICTETVNFDLTTSDLQTFSYPASFTDVHGGSWAVGRGTISVVGSQNIDALSTLVFNAGSTEWEAKLGALIGSNDAFSLRLTAIGTWF